MVRFRYGYDFGFYPDVWNVFVHYCLVKDVSAGPFDYRPKVFQAPVGNAIEASGSFSLMLSIAALVKLRVKGRAG